MLVPRPGNIFKHPNLGSGSGELSPLRVLRRCPHSSQWLQKTVPERVDTTQEKRLTDGTGSTVTVPCSSLPPSSSSPSSPPSSFPPLLSLSLFPRPLPYLFPSGPLSLEALGSKGQFLIRFLRCLWSQGQIDAPPLPPPQYVCSYRDERTKLEYLFTSPFAETFTREPHARRRV